MMLGRRLSTAVPNVDDRHPYPAPTATPELSSFTAPEGLYQLAFEVTPPPPQTPATPGAGLFTGDNPVAIPEHPSSLSTVAFHFPPVQQSSGILGLGGSQRNARSREPSAAELTLSPAVGSQQQLQQDEGNSAISAGSFENQLPGGSSLGVTSPSALPQQPASGPKKRPLISLPSSVGLSALSGSSAQIPQSPATTKPKSAFRGTNSTFIKAYEGLPLSARAEKLWGGPEAREVSLAVFTSGRLVFIADISPRARSRDPVARLAFGQMPTCTAVNQATLSHDRLDLLVGFASGDLMWIECFSGRYTRYNKDAVSVAASLAGSSKPCPVVSSAPVKKVEWLRGDQIFAAGFQDGCIAFFDKDREDPSSFIPQPGQAPQPGPLAPPLQPLARTDSLPETNENSVDGHAVSSSYTNANGERMSGRHRPYLQPLEEYTDDIIVTVPQINNDKKNAGKLNPLAHWRVSKKALTDFALSPDNAHVAVVSEDGCLRIIDAGSQSLIHTFSGYFGALTSVTWSPDGRFVLTGGQDDLACVWSPFEGRIVARCEGHASFLTGLAFDAWRCDGRAQRFASVSEDCRLIFWELSSAALQRPKAHHPHHHIRHSAPHGIYNRRQSAMSSLSLSRRRTIESTGNQASSVENEGSMPLWHRAAKRSEVPGLQPVMAKQISTELLSGIGFLPGMVITVSRNATVKVFLRPDHRY